MQRCFTSKSKFIQNKLALQIVNRCLQRKPWDVQPKNDIGSQTYPIIIIMHNNGFILNWW